MLKRIVLLVVAIAAGISLAGGASVVAAQSAPAIVEVVKAPIVTSDECLCGGGIILISKIELGGGTCLYTWDRGVGTSPRYMSRQAPC